MAGEKWQHHWDEVKNSRVRKREPETLADIYFNNQGKYYGVTAAERTLHVLTLYADSSYFAQTNSILFSEPNPYQSMIKKTVEHFLNRAQEDFTSRDILKKLDIDERELKPGDLKHLLSVIREKFTPPEIKMRFEPFKKDRTAYNDQFDETQMPALYDYLELYGFSIKHLNDFLISSAPILFLFNGDETNTLSEQGKLIRDCYVSLLKCSSNDMNAYMQDIKKGDFTFTARILAEQAIKQDITEIKTHPKSLFDDTKALMLKA